MDHMTIRDLMRSPHHAVGVARTGRPVHITRYGRADVTLIRTADYERGDQATSYLRGLLRLVRDGADARQIADFGDMLAELADTQWLIEDDPDHLPVTVQK